MDSDTSSPPTAGIVAALADGVELVDDGVFTLDFAAARTKLADYRLDEPNRFVLLLVEAAHLFPECTSITFFIDNRETRARLHGVSLSDAELIGFLDAAFFEPEALLDDAARREAGRRMLAVALNGATVLAGRSVEVDSCVDGVRHTLRVEAGDHGHEVETEADEPSEGWLERWRRRHSRGEFIELRVRDRRLASSLTGADARTQRNFLLYRCRCASKPVVVNGMAIGHGFMLTDALAPLELRDERGVVQGIGGYCALRMDSGLEFVANGVVIERMPQPNWRTGLWVIVRAEDLGRDLSLTALVRSPRFKARVELAERADARCSNADHLAPRHLAVFEQANQSVAPRTQGKGMLWSLIERWMKGERMAESDIEERVERSRPGVAQLTQDAVIREWKDSRCELILRLRVYTRDRPPFAHALRVVVDEDERYALHEGVTLHVEVRRAGEVVLS